MATIARTRTAPTMMISGRRDNGAVAAACVAAVEETGTTDNKLSPAGTEINPPNP